MFPILSFFVFLFSLSVSVYGENSSTIINIDSCFFLYSREITIKQDSYSQLLESNWTYDSNTTCNGTMPFTATFSQGPVGWIENVTISLSFVYNGDYTWSMSSGTFLLLPLNNSMLMDSSNITITALLNIPYGFSYTCLQLDPIVTNASSITFNKFQIQAYGVVNNVFGQAHDCVGFFTIPTWSALFVTLLLLMILSYGLAMIMSIQTQNRTNDPKAKHIIVGSATE